MKIRPLNVESSHEISLVAENMKKTLIDVLGPETGENYYSEDWLLERVQQHIQLKDNSAIFLSEQNNGQISGQAIVRIEEKGGERLGIFSTIYVADEYRRSGIAEQLIENVLEWCKDKGLKKVTYNTAENHTPIISLFGKFGFREILKEADMVKLALCMK